MPCNYIQFTIVKAGLVEWWDKEEWEVKHFIMNFNDAYIE